MRGFSNTLEVVVVVVFFRTLDFLQRDDDLVIELLPVLRLAERQVDVVRLVLAVSVLNFQACKTLIKFSLSNA